MCIRDSIRPCRWFSQLGSQPTEGPIADGFHRSPVGAGCGLEPLVKHDIRTSFERAPKQLFGIVLASYPLVKIGSKKDQTLVGIVLELPQPLLDPFQRFRLAGMVEANLRNAKIVIGRRQ